MTPIVGYDEIVLVIVFKLSFIFHFQAGLITEENSEQLDIVLEPEAASLYCRSIEMNQFRKHDVQNVDVKISEGTVYMIIDAGGKYHIVHRCFFTVFFTLIFSYELWFMLFFKQLYSRIKVLFMYFQIIE